MGTQHEPRLLGTDSWERLCVWSARCTQVPPSERLAVVTPSAQGFGCFVGVPPLLFSHVWAIVITAVAAICAEKRRPVHSGRPLALLIEDRRGPPATGLISALCLFWVASSILQCVLGPTLKHPHFP